MSRFIADKTPLLIKFADECYISMSDLFFVARAFLSPDDSIYADFQRVGSIANSGTVESHFSDLVFNSRFTGLVTVSELKHPVTVTAAESIMSFWVPPVTVNLNGLATGAMKVNCDLKRSLKASIIPLIQLIGGITQASRLKAKWPANVLCYYSVLAVTFITSGLSILLNVRKLNCQSVKAFNTPCHGTINRRAISQMLPQSGVDASR